MTDRRLGRRVGAIALVALVAIAAFASLGGSGLAGGLAKTGTAEDGPAQTNEKVTICHKGHVTIRVSVNAWPAHRDRHGDTTGACSEAAVKAAKLKKAKHAKTTKEAKTAAKADAKADKQAKHAERTSDTDG